MLEMGASSDAVGAAALIVVSFITFIAGFALRKWPDKVREQVEGLDGSMLFLTREAHLTVIAVCGWTLTALSFAALAVAAIFL